MRRLVLIFATMAFVSQAPSPRAEDAPRFTDEMNPLCQHRVPSALNGVCGVIDPTDGKAAPVEPLTGDRVNSLTAILNSDFVLLGEVHDNPVHHRLQARFIAARHADRQPRGLSQTAVVFEHIEVGSQPVIDRFEASWRATRRPNDQPPPSAKDAARRLLQDLNWHNSGWPHGSIFSPIFNVVMERNIPMIAGNAARADVRRVAREGIDALPLTERNRLQLDKDLPAPLSSALRTVLKASHCGMLPASAIPNMAAAQRLRDATMATEMRRAAQLYGSAVLLAGNGHIRTDRAVPWHLRKLAPGKSIYAVAIVEVEEGETAPQSYIPRDPDGKPAADLVILTKKLVREDPCKRMRKGASPQK